MTNKETYPAFLFDADDWLTSLRVAKMLPGEKAAYLEAMLYSWKDNGLLDSEVEDIAGIRRHDPAVMRTVVERMFLLGDDGRWRNNTLEKCRKRLKRKSEIGREAGIESGKVRREKARKHADIEQALNVGSTDVEQKKLKEVKEKELNIKEKDLNPSVRDNIEICKEVFREWQNQPCLINHARAKDSPGFKRDFKKRVGILVFHGMKQDDLITAIVNYGYAVKGGAHSWTLLEFLQREGGARRYQYGNAHANFEKQDKPQPPKQIMPSEVE